MVFDGSDKPPTVHDLDADLDAIADGTVSPRHVGRPVIVARFPQKSTEPSSVDIRGGRGEMIEAPDDAIANAPHKPRPRAERVARRCRAPPEGGRAQEAPNAPRSPPLRKRRRSSSRNRRQRAWSRRRSRSSRSLMAPSWDRAAAPSSATSFRGRVDAASVASIARGAPRPSPHAGRPVARAARRRRNKHPSRPKKTASRWGGAVKQIAENRRRIEARTRRSQARQAARGASWGVRSSRRRTRRRTNSRMRLRGRGGRQTRSRSDARAR